MASIIKIRFSDDQQRLFVQLFRGDAAVDLSSADLLIRHRQLNSITRALLVGAADPRARFGRDVTARAKAGVVPLNGELGLPIFNGRTLASVASADVVVTNNAVDGKALVTVGLRGDLAAFQRIYKRRLADNAICLVAEGTDGFAGAGLEIGGATYPATEASLVEIAQTADESDTDGHLSLGTPPAPIAILAGTGAGTLANGTHRFYRVDVAKADSEADADVLYAIQVFDRVTGRKEVFPDSDFEIMQIQRV